MGPVKLLRTSFATMVIWSGRDMGITPFRQPTSRRRDGIGWMYCSLLRVIIVSTPVYDVDGVLTKWNRYWVRPWSWAHHYFGPVL